MSSGSFPICIPSPNFSFPYGKQSDDYFNLNPSDCFAVSSQANTTSTSATTKPNLLSTSSLSSTTTNTSLSSHRQNSNNSVSTTSSSPSTKPEPVRHNVDPKMNSDPAHRQNDSFSSMTSDETMYDTLFTSYRFKKSTDTLVDEPNSPNAKSKNLLNLKLNIPKHRYNQSLSASSTKTLSEIDELGTPVTKASSAVESRFPKTEGMTQPQFKLAKQPTLVKHMTSPTLSHELSFESIKQEQLKRLSYNPTPTSYHASIEQLPHVKYICQAELSHLLNKFAVKNEVPNLLIIDIRPFADFIKVHLKYSINVCLPLTLLKRPNFNLKRCINSLPSYEKTLFQKMLNAKQVDEVNSESSELPAIVIYENQASTGNLYHMCKKLIDNSFWSSGAQPPVYLLQDDFSDIVANLPDITEADHLESTPASPQEQSTPLLSAKLRSVSLSEVPTATPEVVAPPTFCSPYRSSGDTTPILSNFKLPTNLSTQFKIRHNEELLDDEDNDNSFQLNHYDQFMKVPIWIKGAITNKRAITDEFNKLEKFERRRLNLALSSSSSLVTVNPFFGSHGHEHKPASNEIVSPGGTTTESSPSISFGVDYGHKNRYKDIFLYDHSRVKLNDINKRQQCDYINASYLNPLDNLHELVKPMKIKEIGKLKQHMTYIATQGPLAATIGDFWKCVVNHQVPVVISLTDEFEDGVMKCSPFWVPGTYKSNDNEIKVEIVDVQSLKGEEAEKHIVLRSFRITLDQQIVHEVLQIHLLTWPDMSTALIPKDLVSIVMLKNYIVSEILQNKPATPKSFYSAIIHCSAGCGRTGTLCAIDSIINLLRFNQDAKMELKFNPIYSMVNNFRKQRISMVQTLRQYYLIYDTLLIYMGFIQKKEENWQQILESRLVNEFLDRVRK